jgi:hypothetical protein
MHQPSIGCRESSKAVTLSFLNEHFYAYVNQVARANSVTGKCARIAVQNGKETDRGRNANFQEAWPDAVSPLARPH